MDMIDYFVRHERVDHIYVLSAWTAEYGLDWNYINEDDLTPLGVCVELDLRKSAAALLTLDHDRVNQCGFNDYEQQNPLLFLVVFQLPPALLYSYLLE